MINLAVILLCGVVALTIPVLIGSSYATSANPNGTPDWTLVCTYVGDDYQKMIDYPVIWQIEQRRGNTILATWDKFYHNLAIYPIVYDTAYLEITPYGLCYRGLESWEDLRKLHTRGYSSLVTYRGQTCTLILPNLM